MSTNKKQDVLDKVFKELEAMRESRNEFERNQRDIIMSLVKMCDCSDVQSFNESESSVSLQSEMSANANSTVQSVTADIIAQVVNIINKGYDEVKLVDTKEEVQIVSDEYTEKVKNVSGGRIIMSYSKRPDGGVYIILNKTPEIMEWRKMQLKKQGMSDKRWNGSIVRSELKNVLTEAFNVTENAVEIADIAVTHSTATANFVFADFKNAFNTYHNALKFNFTDEIATTARQSILRATNNEIDVTFSVENNPLTGSNTFVNFGNVEVIADYDKNNRRKRIGIDKFLTLVHKAYNFEDEEIHQDSDFFVEVNRKNPRNASVPEIFTKNFNEHDFRSFVVNRSKGTITQSKLTVSNRNYANAKRTLLTRDGNGRRLRWADTDRLQNMFFSIVRTSNIGGGWGQYNNAKIMLRVIENNDQNAVYKIVNVNKY